MRKIFDGRMKSLVAGVIAATGVGFLTTGCGGSALPDNLSGLRFSSAAPPRSTIITTNNPPYVADQVIVALKEGIPRESLAVLVQKYQLGTTVYPLQSDRYYLLITPKNTDIFALSESLRQEALVQNATPNYVSKTL